MFDLRYHVASLAAVFFALAGLGAIAVAILVSPALRHLIEYIALRLRDLLGIG